MSPWRSSSPPGSSSASGPARASGSTRPSPSTSPACPCTPAPELAQARRGAAALLLPAALLDQPLRPVRRRRPLPLGRLRRPDPPRRLALRASASAAGPRPGPCSCCWPARPSPSTTPPSRACTRWSSCSPGSASWPCSGPSQAPRPGNLIAVAVVTAALLYTQYWSVYLVGVVGLWLLRRPSGAPATAASLERRRRARLRSRVGVGVPPLRALGAHLHLPVPAHRHAVGRPAELLRRDQRGHRLHRQPGFDAARRRPNQGRLLAVIYFAMLALALFGIGQERPHHRARPAHPAPARVAWASSWWARCSPPSPAGSSPRAPSPRATPPWCSCPFPPGRPGHHHVAQPQGAGGHRRRSPWSAGLISSAQNIDDAAHPGQRGGRRHQRAGQAGRHHRLLPRPARARRSTARSTTRRSTT